MFQRCLSNTLIADAPVHSCETDLIAKNDMSHALSNFVVFAHYDRFYKRSSGYIMCSNLKFRNLSGYVSWITKVWDMSRDMRSFSSDLPRACSTTKQYLLASIVYCLFVDDIFKRTGNIVSNIE